MSNAIEFVSFNLRKGKTVEDFLLVSDKFNREFLSKQKGYISRKLLVDGQKWADYVLWESKEDVQYAQKIARDDALAREYISFMIGTSCRIYSIEKDY
jgi:hypothetical protein